MNNTNGVNKYNPSLIVKRIKGRTNLLKIISNINWLTLEKVLRQLLRVFISVWVARYLGPEKYGTMSYAVSIVGLLIPLSKLGLGSIVVRNIVKNFENKEVYLGSALILRLVGSLFLMVIAFIGISFLRPDSDLIKIFVVIVAIGYLFRSFETIDLWFQSIVKSKYTVYARSIAFIVVSGLKVILILTQQPLIAFVIMFALDGFIAAMLLIFFYQIKGPVSIFNWKVRFASMKELLKDSWPLILSGFSFTIFSSMDRVMIGNMMSDDAVGIYAAAVHLSKGWHFLPVIITGSLFPAILNAKKKSKELYLKRMQILYDSFTWFTLTVSLIVTLLAPFIINILYGPQYSQASVVLTIHIWSSFFLFLGIASGKYIVAENITRLQLYKRVSGAILNIILNFIFIRFYGVIGAAFATLISISFSEFFSNLFFKKTRIIFLMFLNSFNIVRITKFIQNHS